MVFDSCVADFAAENHVDLGRHALDGSLSADDQLAHALRSEPEVRRQIVLMRIREGMSFGEIGAVVGYTASTTERYFQETLSRIRRGSDYGR